MTDCARRAEKKQLLLIWCEGVLLCSHLDLWIINDDGDEIMIWWNDFLAAAEHPGQTEVPPRSESAEWKQPSSARPVRRGNAAAASGHPGDPDQEHDLQNQTQTRLYADGLRRKVHPDVTWRLGLWLLWVWRFVLVSGRLEGKSFWVTPRLSWECEDPATSSSTPLTWCTALKTTLEVSPSCCRLTKGCWCKWLELTSLKSLTTRLVNANRVVRCTGCAWLWHIHAIRQRKPAHMFQNIHPRDPTTGNVRDVALCSDVQPLNDSWGGRSLFLYQTNVFAAYRQHHSMVGVMQQKEIFSIYPCNLPEHESKQGHRSNHR